VPLPATKNPTELASMLFFPSLCSFLETKSLSVTPVDPAPFVRDPRFLIDSLTFIQRRLFTSPIHFQGHQAFPFSLLSSAPSPFLLSFHALPFFYLSSLSLPPTLPRRRHPRRRPLPGPQVPPSSFSTLIPSSPDPVDPEEGGREGGKEEGRG